MQGVVDQDVPHLTVQKYSLLVMLNLNSEVTGNALLKKTS
jgi:hypothetical protein